VLGPPDDAVGVLRELVALYDEGRRQPLPLPISTSYAWAEAEHSGDDPVQAARWRWKYDAEEPAVEQVWGRGAPLPEGLGGYSSRLWLPLLRAEIG
jgi:exodeoxyribonuclease V gamma subunit